MNNLKNKNFNILLNDISKISFIIFRKEWAEANAGNVSVNISDFNIPARMFQKRNKIYSLKKKYTNLKNKIFLITPAGIRMSSLAESPAENLLIIKILKNSDSYKILYSPDPSFKPTSELLTHLAIHQMLAESGKKEKVVLHTHATELIALSHIRKYKNDKNLSSLIWKMHPESKIFIPEGVGFVKYFVTGSEQLANETTEKFKKYKIVSWEKHGCISIGENIFRAFDYIDIAAKSIRIFFMCRSIGLEPEGLS